MDAGIPVGISQAVDAAEILTVVDLLDREQLRHGLAAVLLQRAAQRPAYDVLFDLWWPLSDRPAPDASADDESGGEPGESGESTLDLPDGALRDGQDKHEDEQAHEAVLDRDSHYGPPTEVGRLETRHLTNVKAAGALRQLFPSGAQRRCTRHEPLGLSEYGASEGDRVKTCQGAGVRFAILD